MAKYLQGLYECKNPQKYAGDVNDIRYRSSWELKAMRRFDNDPSFLKWNSEEKIIPYVSPLDKRVHRYFPDFLVQYKTTKNEIKNAMIEIKPLIQTKPPVKKSRVTKTYIRALTTYLVNEAKWNAAIMWCNQNGWEFKILTEKDLGIV